MKTCVTYHADFKYFDEVDEIRIKFNSLSQIVSLRDFLKEYKDKTVIIDIDDLSFTEYDDFLTSMIEIEKEYKNFIIAYPNIFDLSSEEGGLPHFFDVVIDSWDVIYAICEKPFPPEYVLVGNELGFELEAVSKVLHKNNIKVRCIPDRAQSRWNEMPSIKKFFIRPEDIQIYEECIDTIEFTFDSSIPNVHYEIWVHQKKWLKDISDIVYDYYDTTPNAQVLPGFGILRKGCGKSCLKGGDCKACDQVNEIAEKLEKLELIAPTVSEIDIPDLTELETFEPVEVDIIEEDIDG